MKIILSILFILYFCNVEAQEKPGAEEELNNAQLEDHRESDDTESEDDYDIIQLSHFLKHPLNINSPRPVLEEFPLLEPLLITNLIEYKTLLGDLINVYELQAVPGFSIEIIRRMLPYITVSAQTIAVHSIKELFSKGEKTITVRPTVVPQTTDGSSSVSSAENKFKGNNLALFARYQYQYRDLLGYGVTFDKDAGEPLFERRFPFKTDFESFHFYVRKVGCIQMLVVGDYTINIAQGLIHWQSQAFSKTSAVINIKRESVTVRPYHSSGEFNFHRGAAITMRKGKIETTLFGSYRKLAANTVVDSNRMVVTSFVTSGLNRTLNEITDKGRVKELISGATIKYIKEQYHLGLNFINYQFSIPLKSKDEPYNLYSIRGVTWLNYSFDFSLTVKNFHFFGEAASDRNGNNAFISGLIGTISPLVDIALLARKISKNFHSLYGNAFTENSFPTNENGLYTGISIMPDYRWKIDLYADIFSFPWLKYRVSAPSQGHSFLCQLTWKPSKKTELYSRYRLGAKPMNSESDFETDYVEEQMNKNWRTQVSFQVSQSVLLRNRVELVFFEKDSGLPQNGHVFFADILYKPPATWYSGNFRLMRFQTDGYESRIYAYENDLPYVSSTPSFAYSGFRYYLNLKARVKKSIQLSLKLAITNYDNRQTIGSGLSTIHGSHKSDIKFQFIFTPKG
jgi:hypothetical protein